MATIYCDGGCERNGYPGALATYAAFLMDPAAPRVRCGRVPAGGGLPPPSNNRGELTAIIEALKMATGLGDVTITSDSNISVNTLNTWLPGYRRKHGEEAAAGHYLNYDLLLAAEARLAEARGAEPQGAEARDAEARGVEPRGAELRPANVVLRWGRSFHGRKRPAADTQEFTDWYGNLVVDYFANLAKAFADDEPREFTAIPTIEDIMLMQ